MSFFDISKGKPYPLGVCVLSDGIQFAAALSDFDDSGVLLINRKTLEEIKIPFDAKNRCGNVASIKIRNLNFEEYDYNFYSHDEIIVDPYSRCIVGNKTYGVKDKKSYSLKSRIVKNDFDWEGDLPLTIPFDDTIMYLLHVRGFTKHSSSKVTGKGCYRGIKEKIPYLKKLGITSIEVMPAYEFEEYTVSVPKELSAGMYFDKNSEKINYWGFKKGFYLSPKASYSYSDDPVYELKDLIKELHKNGIEFIMQFYFPDGVKQGYINETLRYWVEEYHIDGVHIKGNNVPITFIATEPVFACTKIFYDYIPEHEIYESTEFPKYVNLCRYSDEFMYSMRKFLKGDEDMLKTALSLIKNHGDRSANANFITNYYGFTLNDLVSYDRKHNEDNGENNADGSDYNFSWNCGVEGPSKKTTVMALRKQMMKNAICSVLLSQGVPVLLAGDEFLNTQKGNNNPYCQDNDITYLNWNSTKNGEEFKAFVTNLISLRKNELRPFIGYKYTMVDRDRIGYPDLSIHGTELYKEDLTAYNRNVGIMCALKKNDSKATLLYMAYNMFWEEKLFAFPNVATGNKWECVIKTGEIKEESITPLNTSFRVGPRSVAVFMCDADTVAAKGMPGKAPVIK